MKARLGIAPIAWWNDDLAELSDDVIRRDVVDGQDRTRESFLDAVIKGAFTVPGDGSLDFGKIVKALAAKDYEGWFVVEAEQDPVENPPLEMARKGHKELMRVMDAAGYEVVK